MKVIKFFIVIFICSVLAACASPALKPSNQAASGVKLAPAKNNDASEFLNFAEAYSDLSAEAQKQELQATNQILARNPNDLLHRMKLVIIYGLPSSSLADTPKAQSLLQQILQESTLSNSKLALAHVMFDYLVAFNKLNKSTQNDDKLIEQLQSKLEATQQKLDAAQQKLEATQQKVNELKNIEKSMGEREPAPRK